MPTRPVRIPRRLAAALAACVLLAAAAVVVLAGIRGPGPAGRPPLADPAAPVAAGSAAATFTVIGDSITADHAYPRDVRRRVVGERSWVNFAQDAGVAFTGGWAVGGATTADMLEGARPQDADVLVMVAGTNDIYAGVPFDRIGVNLRGIAETVGAPRVLVSSVPPRNGFEAQTVAYNHWLAGFVARQGWEWVDAAAGLRADGDPGHYAPGMAYDGVHPSLAGAEVLGTAILAELAGVPTAAEPPLEDDDGGAAAPPAGQP